MHYGGYGGYICFLNGGPVARKPGLLLPVGNAVTVSQSAANARVCVMRVAGVAGALSAQYKHCV